MTKTAAPKKYPTRSRARQAEILLPSPATIRLLAAVLRRGELVGVPTETVYGLAANALDADACAQIFQAKGRPSTDPLIVHVPTLADAEKVAIFNALARSLARAFWPGPLTLVLPKRGTIPAIVTAGLDSVAVRAPRHAAFRALLKAAGLPLAAPSANPFGYISPTTAAHVQESLGGKIGFILDGGPCRVGVESTIVDVRDPLKPRILRPGWITAEQIAEVAGVKAQTKPTKGIQNAGPPKEPPAQLAPGMLARHYSPNTPLRLVKRITRRVRAASGSGDGTAWLFFTKPPLSSEGCPGGGGHVYWLSRDGNPAQAARALFGVLRRLDGQGFRQIVAEIAPDSPWAGAINDRLRRAAAKR